MSSDLLVWVQSWNITSTVLWLVMVLKFQYVYVHYCMFSFYVWVAVYCNVRTLWFHKWWLLKDSVLLKEINVQDNWIFRLLTGRSCFEWWMSNKYCSTYTHMFANVHAFLYLQETQNDDITICTWYMHIAIQCLLFSAIYRNWVYILLTLSICCSS